MSVFLRAAVVGVKEALRQSAVKSSMANPEVDVRSVILHISRLAPAQSGLKWRAAISMYCSVRLSCRRADDKLPLVSARATPAGGGSGQMDKSRGRARAPAPLPAMQPPRRGRAAGLQTIAPDSFSLIATFGGWTTNHSQ